MEVPAEIHCAADYEQAARRFVAGPTYEYIAGGSGPGVTLEANRAAFAGFDIVPRLLRDLRGGHTRLDLLGHRFLHPVMLAPVAFQKLVHRLGELESARAAAATDSCIVCSTLSSFGLEDVADRAAGQRWFQLYFQSGREATLALVERAEAAGYTALVVTLDTPIQAPSLRSLRAGFQMPAEVHAANLADYPAPAPRKLPADASRIFQGMMSEAPGWDDLSWLIGQTRLPVLAKGVLHPDDARAFAAAGLAGLVVSNHGGRTLDGVPASLTMLPAIRQAVPAGFPLLFDGGIRSGRDIFKALALGADAVMIGRLQLYALASAGALGVAHLIRLLREELESCMALAGCATLADIDAGMLVDAEQETRAMLIPVEQVLDRDEVRQFRDRLDAAGWQDGAVTAGSLAREVKRNQQLPDGSELAVSLGRHILAKLGSHPVFVSAALPRRIYPPRFNRYADGGTYGAHVDSALMPVPGTDITVRSDLSATLFLSEPGEYEGGELQIEGVYGVQSVKLPAGDLLLYPSSSLHRVTPVTRGVRMASFFWIESMVADDGERTLLFDLDQSIQGLSASAPHDDPQLLRLTGVYHNLLRRWART